MKNICCVPSCDSRRSSVKFHRFPKSDLKLKWVASINCDELNKVSPDELRKFFVCHKHFEKRFLTDRLRLSTCKLSAYPTLFTTEELNSGTPAHGESENQNVLCTFDDTQTRKRKHEDHTYINTSALDDNAPSSLKLLKTLDQNQEAELQDLAGKMANTTSKNDDNFISDDNFPSNNNFTSNDNFISDNNFTSNNNFTINDKFISNDNFTSNNNFTSNDNFISDDNFTSKDNFISDECDHRAKQQLKPAKSTKSTYAVTPKKTMKRFVNKKKKKTPRKRVKKSTLMFQKKENFDKITSRLNPLAKKILWMQIKQCTKKLKGRRFTDEEKNIALAIMKQSPESYKFLRRIFILPSSRTINKIIYKLQVEAEVIPQVLNAIKTEVENWQESKRYCYIAFEKVAIEPGISDYKHEDNISGLEIKTNDYVVHKLVFMLRGAVHKWQKPICSYFCEGFTPAQALQDILKEVVIEVINTGLIPVALVSDQGKSLQLAIHKLRENSRRQQLAEENIDDTIIEIEGQKINVLYDPSHLIRGLQKNFLNKDIILNGNLSKWSDIVDVYLTDCRQIENMRLLKKLNDEDVIPEKVKKNEVINCTRVLSKTVAGALAYTAQFSHYADGSNVSKTLRNTAETVSFLDDLFDSCNGAEPIVKNKGKPLRQAVTNTSKHEVFWKEAITKLEQMRFLNNAGKEIMVPSQKKIITTLKGMARIWQFLKEKGHKTMCLHYYNSDPYENILKQ